MNYKLFLHMNKIFKILSMILIQAMFMIKFSYANQIWKIEYGHIALYDSQGKKIYQNNSFSPIKNSAKVMNNQFTATDINNRSIVLNYDEKKRILTNKYSDGQSNRYVYDQNGQKISRHYESNNVNSIHPKMSDEKYDENGNIIEYNAVFHDGAVRKEKYVYDDKGMLIKFNYIDKNKNKSDVSEGEITYSRAKKIKSELMTTDKFGNKKITTQNLSNNTQSSVYKDQNDNPLTGIYETKYYKYYVKDGELVEYIEFLENDLRGNSKYQKYNNNDEKTEILYKDQNDNPLTGIYETTNTLYVVFDGSMLSYETRTENSDIEYYDKEGRLIKKISNLGTIYYNYGSNGKIIKEVSLEKNGEGYFRFSPFGYKHGRSVCDEDLCYLMTKVDGKKIITYTFSEDNLKNRSSCTENLTECITEYYAKDGSLIEKYDENMLPMTLYDNAGNPIIQNNQCPIIYEKEHNASAENYCLISEVENTNTKLWF